MVLSPVELNAMGDDELCQHVEAVIEELNNPNSERKWFKKAPYIRHCRHSYATTFKALGTPTVQVGELCSDRTEITPEEAATAAQKRRNELEIQGEIDWVEDRQPYPTGQGPVPDKELVGKLLEVRWRYRHKTTGQPVYIWCEGEVVQAADGETDKKSHQRCRKVLPAGALRIKWPADVAFDEDESYVWSMLNPKSFNRNVHLGWRFAGSELRRMEMEEQANACNKPSKKKSRTTVISV